MKKRETLFIHIEFQSGGGYAEQIWKEACVYYSVTRAVPLILLSPADSDRIERDDDQLNE